MCKEIKNGDLAIMKKLSIDTASLARLARLELTEAEHERMARELGEFVEFAAVLSSFDGSFELEDCKSLEELRCREDQARAGDTSLARGYVTVPLTVEAEK